MVEYDRRVPKTVRNYCDKHADQIADVWFGGRDEDWRYMAWLRAGWNDGNDVVHSVIGDTAADLIERLREVDKCDCSDECRAASGLPDPGYDRT